MILSQNNFNKYLNQKYIFETRPEIAVAVSGGPDSMCLAFLLNNWVKKNRGFLTAIIIDHGIRKESFNESKYVKNYLSKFKIKSVILRISKKNIIKKTMNEARSNRFNKLINYCTRKNILHLFLGHHYDDNLETYLLRKLAGSNFEGLRAMQNKSSLEKLQILRPLLAFNKQIILKYNYVKKINFLEDPSNINLKYSRVVIREFLSKNIYFKKILKKDFNEIINYYPFYKQMIFQIFNKLILKINHCSVAIDLINFVKQDIEIQCKIIEVIYKYIYPKKGYIRYQKILLFLKILNKKNNFRTNLAGMNIEKHQFSLVLASN